MATGNEIWLNTGKRIERLDLNDDVSLLPSFQANDRTKPDTIQSDYSPEFEAPGTAHNHRLLKQAAASQPVPGAAYVRVPCVLTSGDVETLPLGLLYLKGYKEGKYQLQLFGGNRRLVEALGDKKLADLDLNRFNHYWTRENILAGLPYAHWQSQGWGYSLYERGKPLDLQQLDPFTLYPACAGELVFQQILTDAGFTADSLLGEPLFAALEVPAPNAYTFSQDFRDARQLTAGYTFENSLTETTYYHHSDEFDEELLRFTFTERKPYHAPDATTGVTYADGRYTADTLAYYDLAASVSSILEINSASIGSVRVKFQLKVNGQVVYDGTGSDGSDETVTDETVTRVYTPKLKQYLLRPGDYVELYWRGQKYKAASGTQWRVGATGSRTYLDGGGPLDPGRILANEVRLTVTMLPLFPEGGLVRLQDWLPDVKQLDFVKTYLLLGGLTIQCDAYEPHLRLSTGQQLFRNLASGKVRDWTPKRDAYAQPGRLSERELAFRFGGYGQRNYLRWEKDDHVLEGYGDGTLTVADQVLDQAYELAKLPFAATQDSPAVNGLLRILNFDVADFTADPVTYNNVEAKPRLTLRRADGELTGKLVMTPAEGFTPAVLADFTTTAAYFAGVDVSLLLDGTVLGQYWADLRAMLAEARYLTEYYRLTPQDIAELDFAVPIWDAWLGDYFAVSVVGEYDARRPVEVRLARLNAAHLPPPRVPGEASPALEWWGSEFYLGEWY